MKIRFMRDYRFWKCGLVLDTPYDGMANLLIKRGIAVEMLTPAKVETDAEAETVPPQPKRKK